MPESVSESDLLALIEGALTPERSDEVMAALRADPALRARVERMGADRGALARLPDSLTAPHRSVETAMRRAAETASGERQFPARRRPAMLAAAGLGIAVLVGVLALIINATHPGLRARRLASTPPTPARDIRMLDTEPEVIGPVAEETAESAPPTTTGEDIERRLAELEATTEEDPLLESFLANIGSADTPASNDAAPSLTTPEIVALLREGALAVRITIDPAAPPGAIDHADANGAPPRADSPRALPTSIPVNLPEGAPDEEVLEVLNRALVAIRVRSGVRVEFVRVPSPGAAQAPLATDPHAVVWWSAPADTWRTQRTREVPILVVPEPPSSDAPPQAASG